MKAFTAFSTALAALLISSTPPCLALTPSNGAVSGGGGGTLPADPVSIREIEEIVQNSIREMRLVGREMSRRVRRGSESPIQAKLFGGSKTILDILEETGYELHTDKPCLDRFGNEVDASIFASKPGKICISAFRIAPKVIQERARVETLALIFHELSHLLGTTETEATEFQKDVAFLLSKADPTTLDLPASHMFSEYADTLARSLKNYATQMKNGSSADVLDQLARDLSKHMYDFTSAIRPQDPYSRYTRRQFEYVEWLETRMEIMRYLLYARFDDQPEHWEKELDKIFGEGGYITTYGSYLRQQYPTSYIGNDFENNILMKPQTDTEVITELEALSVAFRQEARFLHPFGSSFGLALLKHASDNPNSTRSPFAMFLGAYEIQNPTCTSNNYKKPEDRIPLKVEFEMNASGDPSQVNLKKSWTSMWGTDVLEENGSTSLGGSVVRIAGSDQPGLRHAEAKAVYGTPWSERWMIQTTRIEERAGVLYYVDTYQNHERSWRGPFDSSYHCEARLQAL